MRKRKDVPTDPYEYHTVAVDVISGPGAKQVNKVVERMQRQGWEYVSQSPVSRIGGGVQTNVIFRRFRAKGNPKPAVGDRQVSCCMLSPMILAGVVLAGVTVRAIRKTM